MKKKKPDNVFGHIAQASFKVNLANTLLHHVEFIDQY